LAHSLSKGSIESVRDIERIVLAEQNNKERCVVAFDAFIRGQWQKGQGHLIYPVSIGKELGCYRALKRGKTDQIEQNYPQSLSAEQILICDDREQEEANILI
jgi:hypothetical protein